MTYWKEATNKDTHLSDGGYGHFDRTIHSVQKNDTRNWKADKTKNGRFGSYQLLPCYAVSYDRTGFANALSRHVNVDKYDPCGSLPCKDLGTCGLQKNKLCLALENS